VSHIVQKLGEVSRETMVLKRCGVGPGQKAPEQPSSREYLDNIKPNDTRHFELHP